MYSVQDFVDFQLSAARIDEEDRHPGMLQTLDAFPLMHNE
jgi:hypothetical protein